MWHVVTGTAARSQKSGGDRVGREAGKLGGRKNLRIKVEGKRKWEKG
jgi:hypothetical protein